MPSGSALRPAAFFRWRAAPESRTTMSCWRHSHRSAPRPHSSTSMPRRPRRWPVSAASSCGVPMHSISRSSMRSPATWSSTSAVPPGSGGSPCRRGSSASLRTARSSTVATKTSRHSPTAWSTSPRTAPSCGPSMASAAKPTGSRPRSSGSRRDHSPTCGSKTMAT